MNGKNDLAIRVWSNTASPRALLLSLRDGEDEGIWIERTLSYAQSMVGRDKIGKVVVEGPWEHVLRILAQVLEIVLERDLRLECKFFGKDGKEKLFSIAGSWIRNFSTGARKRKIITVDARALSREHVEAIGPIVFQQVQNKDAQLEYVTPKGVWSIEVKTENT